MSQISFRYGISVRLSDNTVPISASEASGPVQLLTALLSSLVINLVTKLLVCQTSRSSNNVRQCTVIGIYSAAGNSNEYNLY